MSSQRKSSKTLYQL